MALSAARTWKEFSGAQIATLPMRAATKCYGGGYVGKDPGGYAKPFEPGDELVGLAIETIDNTSANPATSAAAGALNISVYTSGDFEETLTSVAYSDVGKAVYATADDAIGLKGHPDGFVGRIIAKTGTNLCRIRLKSPGALPMRSDTGSIEVVSDFVNGFGTVTGVSAGADGYTDGFKLRSKAAAGSPTISQVTDLPGVIKSLLASTNEAENCSILTAALCDISRGVTFECTGRLSVAGGAATDDVDFGIAALSGGLTDTQLVDMDATTSGLKSAKFHLDANANDVYATSDDDASPVTATDTTIDNSTSADKTYKVIARTTGAVELWVDGTRVLSSTAFNVSNSGVFGGFINIEKSTGTGVPELRFTKARLAGGPA